MALRVLLADESPAIKKVMQLSLQDYGVEVKAIPTGEDGLPVAKSFRPDIIFVDVLLSKKSGYELARELKSDPELNRIPVVLMRSNFMELDEAKASQCGADRRLEKPFDADTLRSMVRELVPKTAQNPISSYLHFPPMPEFVENSSASGPSLDIYALPEAEEDKFTAVPLTANSKMDTSSPDSWSQASVRDVNIAAAPADQGLEKYMIPPAELQGAKSITQGQFEEVVFDSAASSVAPPTFPSKQSLTDTVLAEKVLREEAAKVLENICWKILPEIAERVVREEINKLLKETEKNL
ncbi:MAG: response regulator [Bdellovibrionaceae bacterium]|nr:response regulator [Pseudobdellovibrionaceae bacterium]